MNQEKSQQDRPDREAVAGQLPYASFGTSIGDDYEPTDPEILKNGWVLAAPIFGKHLIEEACKRLRSEGIKIDWTAINNSVVVITTECESRKSELRGSLVSCVRSIIPKFRRSFH